DDPTSISLTPDTEGATRTGSTLTGAEAVGETTGPDARPETVLHAWDPTLARDSIQPRVTRTRLVSPGPALSTPRPAPLTRAPDRSPGESPARAITRAEREVRRTFARPPGVVGGATRVPGAPAVRRQPPAASDRVTPAARTAPAWPAPGLIRAA